MYRRLKLFRVFIAFIAMLGTFLCVVSRAEAQIVFTEVDYHTDRVEIVNMGASAVDISTWHLCVFPMYPPISTLPILSGDTTLSPGEIVVFDLSVALPLRDNDGELGLYVSGPFGDSNNIRSYVQWGNGGHTRAVVAVAAGIWSDANDFVPRVAVAHSLEYKGTGNSPEAWFDQPDPNFGAFGEEAFVPSIIINEVDYRVTDRVELKNVSSDSVDIGTWVLCSRFDYSDPISELEIVEGDTNLAPGATVVISVVNSPFSLNDNAADLGLYSRAVFEDPDNMESFVQWGSSGNGRESVAVQKGIWTAGDFVSSVSEGHSIEYDGDGFASSDWIDQASPTLGVTPVFGVTLEVVGETAQSTDDATAGVTYTLTVTNTGNQDDTINLSVSPEAGIDGSLSTTSVELSADTSQEITLTVTGDALTEAGDYQVTVTAASAGDASMTDEVSTTTTIETPAVFGVTLEVVGVTAQSTDDATAGVTYTLTVTNTGNQDDTINLSVSPEAGIDGSLSTTSVELVAETSQEITLTVTGDALTEAGDYQVTVTAASDGDANMTDEVVTTTTIEISAVFGVTLEVVGEAAQSTDNAIAGVTYTLKITNTGNQDDTINLSVSPEVGIEGSVLGSLSTTSVELAADTSQEITLTVTGDAFTEAGNYQVTVTATSAGDTSMTDEVSTTTTVQIVLATPWDVNADGVVNVFDLVLVGREFGQSGENLAADVDGNGTINIFDLVIVASHFGEETALASPAIR